MYGQTSKHSNESRSLPAFDFFSAQNAMQIPVTVNWNWAVAPFVASVGSTDPVTGLGMELGLWVYFRNMMVYYSGADSCHAPAEGTISADVGPCGASAAGACGDEDACTGPPEITSDSGIVIAWSSSFLCFCEPSILGQYLPYSTLHCMCITGAKAFQGSRFSIF